MGRGTRIYVCVWGGRGGEEGGKERNMLIYRYLQVPKCVEVRG